MPDDQVQDSVASDAVAPQIDYDTLAERTASKLRESFQTAPQPQRYQPPQPQGPPDPVKELVDPYVQPYVQRAERSAALAEEIASDAASFYSKHRDLESKDIDEIEKRFRALRANGVPFKREDILAHYRGENLDKEVEKRIKSREEAAVKAANAAAVVGPGSPDKARTFTDPNKMSTDELEKALDGVAF